MKHESKQAANDGPGASSAATREWRIQCSCGATVPISDERTTCVCKKELARRRKGVIEVTGATPYWGEVSAEVMEQLLTTSVAKGWREAVQTVIPASLQEYILSPQRAAFQDVLPLADGSCFLDVGAGLGGICTQLARRHHVVALEGVRERAQFIALRKEQDNLRNLTVLNGDLNTAQLAAGQFDGIVVNGVLEWVGLFDLSAPPEVIQVRFLESLRRLLAPGGGIYVGIENRIGWAQLHGDVDHSGLPYTSLLPRFLARLVCSASKNYRSHVNAGYRTYTYSYSGYEKLFQRAGLGIRSAHISIHGYNRPTELVPIRGNAINYYAPRRTLRPATTLKLAVRNYIKLLLARERLWRIFGGDYIFFLEALDAQSHS
jgi:SAM-dependent methyltransferase